jgi:transporter family-2 protein
MKLSYMLAIIAGISVAVQVNLNQKLMSYVPRSIVVLTSHLGGALFMAAIIMFFSFKLGRSPMVNSMPGQAPWYLWSGGVFGVIIVSCITVALMDLPLPTTLSLVIAGELFTGLLFEWVSLPYPIISANGAARVLGAIFICSGAYLLKAKM